MRGAGKPAGSVRIIGGRWRGRKLPVADLPGLRPTPDRVRETLFNWLAPDLAEIRVLDLFAGTGALGFEALSRGAGSAVLVEREARAVSLLRQSASLLEATAEIVAADALAYLSRPSTGFDLVFVDPPFAATLWTSVLSALPPHLRAGHRVYVEAPKTWPGPAEPGWRVLKEKAVADVVMRLLDYSEPLSQASPSGERP